MADSYDADMFGTQPELRDATVAELSARLHSASASAERFDPEVVLELARRAEIGERLQAQIRKEALSEISSPEGYSTEDF